MKKPLLILVDDDGAVLEALEALLSPELSEICRIEAYERPEDVLAVVPGWQAEQRPLALAIVDQKMPGMAGVELIRKLRQAVAEPFRAILLTGYAGLDSAVEGKNEADVNGYIEKPWDGELLRRTIRDLIRSTLRQLGVHRHLILYETTEPSDLEAVFRKRYEVYRTSPQAALFPPNNLRMMADGFDRRAHHIVIRQVAGTDSFVGTARVATDGPGPALESISQLMRNVMGLDTMLGSEPTEPLPVMTWFPGGEAVKGVYMQLRRDGTALVEPGRLAVDGAVRVLQVVAWVVEAIAAIQFRHHLDHAVLTCIPPHRRLYRRLGFTSTPGTKTEFVERVGTKITCLLGSREGITGEARARVETILARLQARGAACHCPSYPTCLPDAYVTGNFRGIDIFCPLRAGEILARDSEDPDPLAPIT